VGAPCILTSVYSISLNFLREQPILLSEDNRRLSAGQGSDNMGQIQQVGSLQQKPLRKGKRGNNRDLINQNNWTGRKIHSKRAQMSEDDLLISLT